MRAQQRVRDGHVGSEDGGVTVEALAVACVNGVHAPIAYLEAFDSAAEMQNSAGLGEGVGHRLGDRAHPALGEVDAE